ncbi:hypothetical protein B566_EDAN015278 [Ephemera danica]|nr:hypothetical protein B566_EDAN015278 [Ephemera danica]
MGSSALRQPLQAGQLVCDHRWNRLGQSEPTSLQHDMEVYRKRLAAFGFNALVIDGHDVEELCKAFHEASITEGKPTVILAKTYKGKGFPNVEDLENWHGKPLGDKAQSTIESMATREAYGVALAKLAQNNTRVIALDGETKNSTYSDKIKKIRMGAISQTNVNFVESHCGVSIGEDGPSQMGSTVFYPSDAVSCERAIELAANTKGVCFSAADKVLVIGAGVTVYEALTAAEELAKSNIHVRVMDLFTVKPLDAAAIIENAKECGGRIITVEDHYPEAVLSAVTGERNIVTKMLAVREIPRSGPPNALLEKYGISAKSIVVAVKEIIKA